MDTTELKRAKREMESRITSFIANEFYAFEKECKLRLLDINIELIPLRQIGKKDRVLVNWSHVKIEL